MTDITKLLKQMKKADERTVKILAKESQGRVEQSSIRL